MNGDFRCWHTVLLLQDYKGKNPSWNGKYKCANCDAIVRVKPPSKKKGNSQ